MRPITVAILSVSLFSFALPSAHANFGNFPGGWHSEPKGLQNIQIASEHLTIDLRGCDGSEVAPSAYDSYWKQPVGKVEAVYNLHNRGPAREVHLIFASGSLIERDAFHVTINDKPLSVMQTAVTKTEWAAIDRDSRVSSRNGIPEKATNFSVWLTIPAGFSTLRADFRTLIGNDREALPTAWWRFIYLLAPARDWGGFDKLDVTVFIPPGWKAESNLDLQRDGDILNGTFDHIPADDLELTIRMPSEPILQHIDGVRQLTWLIVAVWVPVILFATRIIGRRIRTLRGKALLMLASALVWGVTAWLSAWFLLVYPAMLSWIPWFQRGSSGSTFGDGGIEWFFTWIISFVVAACGVVMTHFLVSRKLSISHGR